MNNHFYDSDESSWTSTSSVDDEEDDTPDMKWEDEDTNRPLRTSTWNVNNMYREEALAVILVLGEIDYLSIQEPLTRANQNAERWLQVSQNYLRKYGYEAIAITKNQVVIVDQEHLGHGLKKMEISYNGRVITSHFAYANGK